MIIRSFNNNLQFYFPTIFLSFSDSYIFARSIERSKGTNCANVNRKVELSAFSLGRNILETFPREIYIFSRYSASLQRYNVIISLLALGITLGNDLPFHYTFLYAAVLLRVLSSRKIKKRITTAIILMIIQNANKQNFTPLRI